MLFCFFHTFYVTFKTTPKKNPEKFQSKTQQCCSMVCIFVSSSKCLGWGFSQKKVAIKHEPQKSMLQEDFLIKSKQMPNKQIPYMQLSLRTTPDGGPIPSPTSNAGINH